MCPDAPFAEISARDHSLFRSLIRTATDGILVIDEDGVVLLYSAVCIRLFQHVPEAVLGNTIAMLLAPSCRDEFREYLSKVMAASTEDATLSPVSTPHDWLGLRKDGIQFPMQVSLGGGALDGQFVFLATVHDLTALHRERIAHGEDTAYLALIVESSNDAIISYMLDGTVRSWNRGAEKMFGYSAREVVGVNAKLLRPIFVPPDMEAAEEVIFAHALAGENVLPYESVRLHRNGTPVPVLLSASPIRDAQCQIIGIARTLHDISEHHAFEQQRAVLSDIAESSSNAIICYALDGTITSWNRAAENIYGYKGSEVIGDNFYERISQIAGSGQAEIEKEIERKLIKGERTSPFEATRTRKNGTTAYVLVSVSPIRGAKNAIVGATRIVRDLTAHKDFELRLEAMRQDMIHVARMHELSLVSAAIAHELNQPLSAMLNYSSAANRLVANGDFAKLPDVAKRIGDQARRASEIVKRMRAFVEKRPSHRAVEDINAIVDDAVALALLGVKAANIETKYELAPDAPPVLADHVQIQQVLVNLLRNAVEAMANTKHRELTLATRKRDDALIEVSVSDTGSGISESVAARLFSPFVTTKANGMGIGLAISKTIIEDHGGELTMAPNPRGGTIFRFTLPVMPADAAA